MVRRETQKNSRQTQTQREIRLLHTQTLLTQFWWKMHLLSNVNLALQINWGNRLSAKKSKEKLKQKMMREGYLRVHAELARARREWHSQQANAFLARLKNFSLLSTLFLQT